MRLLSRHYINFIASKRCLPNIETQSTQVRREVTKNRDIHDILWTVHWSFALVSNFSMVPTQFFSRLYQVESRLNTGGRSCLISANSDFKHVAHQGPDERINLIHLKHPRQLQALRSAGYSTGNFSQPQQQQLIQQHLRGSEVSLQSISSRQSTDQVGGTRFWHVALRVSMEIAVEGPLFAKTKHRSISTRFMRYNTVGVILTWPR